ncbi:MULTISPECIES: catalase [unclassified Streptomyces]|uniref:catalase n=1 Tax=Streptomyces sp. T21Q-yed TaxID=3018441 RepID=UPI002366DE03|nr:MULTISPECIES: catalase [unclassified Streptomyces]MDF3141205.1 catalase [Streptomyces sp. T21Q-yed]WDF42638.1 catalase [Streptomyces sp. T12]
MKRGRFPYFDLLDATKLIPGEQVPVRPIGRMVLNRKPRLGGPTFARCPAPR